MVFAFDTSRYSKEQLDEFRNIMYEHRDTLAYGNKFYDTECKRDLITALSDARFDTDSLERVTENTLRELFLVFFSGKYGGGSGKNLEIIKHQRAVQRAKRQGAAPPHKELDPTRDRTTPKWQ